MLLKILLDSHVIGVRSLSVRLRDSHFYRLISSIPIGQVRLYSNPVGCLGSSPPWHRLRDLSYCHLVVRRDILPHFKHTTVIIKAVALIIHLSNDIASVSAISHKLSLGLGLLVRICVVLL